MTDARTLEAIEASDTDQLLRIVDGHCKTRDWDALDDIRMRCREAVSRGKQLWAVDEHVRYRIALEAPPERAGAVLGEGRARFALGPLSEVAASNNTWSALSPHLPAGPERLTVAAERIIRGDEVDEVIDLPGLQPWEPQYPTARYKSDRIEAPQPKLPGLRGADLPKDVVRVNDDESEAALNDLIEPWIDQSNGRSQTVSVEGGCLDAISALGPPQVQIADLKAEEALAQMAWAAASGGAHGERRGAAAGRYLAWWAVASIADLGWPAEAGRVGEAARRMSWMWFDDYSPPGGWAFRLAAADPELGIAWAITASDLAD